MPTRVTRLQTSTAELPEDSAIKRLPRAPLRPRSAAFRAQYEERMLYYDCFRHHRSSDVLLVGPPPFNLRRDIEAARFFVGETKTHLVATHHFSRSTMLTRLCDVPADAETVTLGLGGHEFDLPIRPNQCDGLAGHKVLFTMNKDNEPVWIRDWIDYHRELHGVTALVFFDNGSTRYSIDELEALLADCGLDEVVLVSWPHKYGARDSRVLFVKYWAHFLQTAAFNIVLRRLGRTAQGLLNCDVDEFIEPVPSGSVFDLPRRATHGVASLAGEWVSNAIPEGRAGTRHFDFWFKSKSRRRKLCPRKWVLDPGRDWLDSPDVFPMPHRIFNTPDKRETQKKLGRFWHFEGINTNWKKNRRRTERPDLRTHFEDATLRQALATVWPGQI